MFSVLTLTTLLSTFALTSIQAQMVPTSPSSSTVARIGSELTTLWEKDGSGVWNDVTIQLMSGDNFQMIPVTTVGSNIDATTLTSYTFTVPSVTPTSAIYFLQFTPGTGNISDVTWTTRFTIAGEDGSTTPPANSVQPNGASIPWGVGSLTDGSGSSGAIATGGTSNSTASGTATGNGAVTTAITPVPAASAASSMSASMSMSMSMDDESSSSSASSSQASALAASGGSTTRASGTAAAAATSTGAGVLAVGKVGMGGVFGALLAGVVML